MIEIYFDTLSITQLPTSIIRMYNILMLSLAAVLVKQCRLLNRMLIISHCRVPCASVYFKRKTSPINLQLRGKSIHPSHSRSSYEIWTGKILFSLWYKNNQMSLASSSPTDKNIINIRIIVNINIICIGNRYYTSILYIIYILNIINII